MGEITKRLLAFFSLFGSLSTLLCCALPVTLVSIGMGATFASLTSTFPQIIWLAQRKGALFIVTGVLLGVSFWSMRHAEKLACPIDPALRDACQSSKKVSGRIFRGTVIVYFIGFLFSYILPEIL